MAERESVKGERESERPQNSVSGLQVIVSGRKSKGQSKESEKERDHRTLLVDCRLLDGRKSKGQSKESERKRETTELC